MNSSTSADATVNTSVPVLILNSADIAKGFASTSSSTPAMNMVKKRGEKATLATAVHSARAARRELEGGRVGRLAAALVLYLTRLARSHLGNTHTHTCFC